MVVHHLRRLRRAVPGRHRAHRPHRRHAPLPGADRVGVPVRGRRDAAQPREQGQPVGPGRHAAATSGWTDLAFEVPRAEPGRAAARRRRVPVLGRLRRRARGPLARRSPAPFAELLHTAGVEFAVLGAGETCTGDPARRLGNEFLFQMLGMQNVETLNAITRAAPLKIVATCPHCFNTLANEYPQLGGHYEVVHHTQLLGRLVAEGGSPRSQPVDKTSPTTTRATSAGTTRSTRRRARCSAPIPGLHSRRRCTAARSAASAAAPAARGCGWRRRSASGSTSSAPTRRSASTPT